MKITKSQLKSIIKEVIEESNFNNFDELLFKKYKQGEYTVYYPYNPDTDSNPFGDDTNIKVSSKNGYAHIEISKEFQKQGLAGLLIKILIDNQYVKQLKFAKNRVTNDNLFSVFNKLKQDGYLDIKETDNEIIIS